MQGERWDKIFEQIRAGVNADEIARSLKRDGSLHRQDLGAETENCFEDRMFTLFGRELLTIRRSEPHEDLDGVDFFVKLEYTDELPVQVKSSDREVSDFKQDPRFVNNFGRRIIVINSAPYVRKKVFIARFQSELRRIKELDNKGERSHT